MHWLWALVVVLVALGSVLAIAETSVSRMTSVRAMALREAGRRNAETLWRIESDPAPYLNAIYLCVMFVQNGSAILVAVLAEQTFDELWVTALSFLFTIAYFVVVEAMSKTFGILNSATAALALAPLVWLLGRTLRTPTRLLIGLGNVLLPGRGLKEGPFVTPEEIRTMADLGRKEGTVGEQERGIIQSVFDLGDTLVKEMMVPRPDIVAVPATCTLQDGLDLMLASGHWRIPVYREEPANLQGVVYAEDVLQRLRVADISQTVESVMREPFVVPETKRAAELLAEMQTGRVHLAIAVDEYGTTSGLVTLEDILEELVGDIADEYDRQEPTLQKLADGTYRVSGSLSIEDFSQALGVEPPEDGAETVGGLVYGLLGRVPKGGETVRCAGVRFTVLEVARRRIVAVRAILDEL
jgi:CBS domain containing-hemolysin-like protein